MKATDVAAWIGAFTGTLVLLWDIFKWVHSGAKIKVSASPNMTCFGGAAPLLGEKTYVAVEATNVGQSKTTITHLVGFHYKSWFRQLLRLKPEVNIAAVPLLSALPAVLDTGERWIGIIEQDPELEVMGREGYLYFGVYHSTSKRLQVQRLVIHTRSKA